MKEKTLKKFLLGIVLILAIVLVSTNSYADIAQTDTASITIDGLEEGVGVTLYQLVTVNYDYTTQQPSDPAYTWVSAVNTWLASTSYSTYADNPEAFYNAITSNSEEAAAFYNTIAKAIKDGNLTLTAAKTGNADSSGEFAATELEMGTYLILVDNGYSVYQPTAVNIVPEFNETAWILNNATATIKSEALSITKTAGTSDDSKDNYSTADTISFTIVADVPTYLDGSISKTYAISDLVGEGLTYDSSSLKVYGVVGGTPTELTEADGDFTLGTTRPDASGTTATFVLNFVYDEISAYDTIKVTYDATLDRDTDLTMTTDGNSNTAYLDYSNNYYTSTVVTQSSEYTVYTYGIKVTKVDKITTTTTLSGAQFNLLSGSSELYFVGSNGVYYLANSTDTGATTTLEVDSNGLLCLYGLDVGTYTLKETKAPDGYNLSQTTTTITLTDADLDGILDDADETDGITELTFTNSQGFILPVTGGVGTVIFGAMGIVLFGLGALLLIVILKRKTAKK